MSAWTQILPLVGVVVGSIGTFLVARLNEKAKWERDHSIRWDVKRLETHASYLQACKRIALLAGRVTAAAGTDTGARPMDTEAGLELIEDAETDRSGQFENVALLGSRRTVAAAWKLNESLWNLEALAAKSTPISNEEWVSSYAHFRKVRTDFIDAARADMGVGLLDVPIHDLPSPATDPNLTFLHR